MTFEEFEQLPKIQRRELFNRLIGLIDEVAVLRVEVNELKAQIAKSSSNSSKPPSSDGLKKSLRTQSNRTSSGKKPGGQSGRKGASLKQIDHPDFTIGHQPLECRSCGKSLEDEAPIQTEERQVFDLPELKVLVTAHIASTKRCACGALTCGSFPAGVAAPVQYGANVQSIATYMSAYQFVPYARLAEFFSDIFGIALSPATAMRMIATSAASVESTVDAIKRAVIASALAHFDETGLRCEKKLMWLHSASNELHTHYAVSLRRGKEAMDEIGILPLFKGKAVHDAWAPYFSYLCGHFLCNAHHLRELRFIHEEYGETWAKRMSDLLMHIKSAVDRSKERDGTKLKQVQLRRFGLRYQAIITAGRKHHARLSNLESAPPRRRGRIARPKGKNLLERLQNGWHQALGFMYDFSVPFTNNLAERDIRMQKVKEKISGCFRTLGGAQNFALLRSYMSTARKQGHCVLTALKLAVINQPLTLGAAAGT